MPDKMLDNFSFIISFSLLLGLVLIITTTNDVAYELEPPHIVRAFKFGADGDTHRQGGGVEWIKTARSNYTVKGFNIYLNGSYETTVGPNVRVYVNPDLFVYESVSIYAFDTAGNFSGESNRAFPAQPYIVPEGEFDKPTTPQITDFFKHENGNSIRWTYPTDNQGIKGFNVEKNGQFFKSWETSRMLDRNGLSGDCYRVSAYDRDQPVSFSEWSDEKCVQ